MYPVVIHGDNPVAWAMARLCRRSGFDDITLDAAESMSHPPFYTLGANQTRILQALVGSETLLSQAYAPNRLQVRFARSEYLLSELPLGRFYHDRYGAPLLNMEANALTDLLRQAQPTEATPVGIPMHIQATREMQMEGSADSAVTLRFVATPGKEDHANVLWLGEDALLWQFSTPGKVWHLLTQAADHDLQIERWAPRLQPLLEQLDTEVSWAVPQPREYWVEGDYVSAGPGSYGYHPFSPETWLSGLEDAWVLSRMMENYEEARQEGWQEYERYRKPRMQRIHRHNQAQMLTYLTRQPARRWLRNLKIALSTRFLPEIAMQRQDWLHQYDCIRGFN